MSDPQTPSFADLALSAPILQALAGLGYEVPSPVQARGIPPLLAGRDVIGRAQTGTGKTAAFSLPVLQRLDPDARGVQALILTPTRELSIQVAEAIHAYSKHLGRVDVLPVYGGQPIVPQLKRLSRGVQVVVGTPGRVADHLRRGSLSLAGVRTVVLDEADEMLRVGFLDEVEWILGQAPAGRQIALFSATMPPEIRRVARKHMVDPVTVEFEHRVMTVPTVEQRYLNVGERHKLEALTRVLEAEPSDAVLIFARTKLGAADLTEKLVARGYAAEALHGDLSQAQRETVLRRFRNRQVELVVATDVAARGLDVEHITHVINYDIPNDVESYVHRVGRTGRAGRSGVALLFVAPREQRMLREIERYTGKALQAMKIPTGADVAARRVAEFKESIRASLQQGDLDLYLALVEELAEEGGYEMAEVAAAAARVARGDKPLAVELAPLPEVAIPAAEDGMARLFLAAGSRAGVRASDVVGAIANEAGVPGKAIGSIDIYEDFTFVEVPRQYLAQVLTRMVRATIRGRPIRVREAGPHARSPRTGARRPAAPAKPWKKKG